jgi:uncharacterized protein (DUF885 family)
MKVNLRSFRILPFAFAAWLLGASVSWAATSDDAKFERVAHRFIEQLLVLLPESATALGDHRFDKRVRDLTLRGVATERLLYETTLTRLNAIDPKLLSPNNSVDRSILMNELRSRLFDIDVMKEPQRNPLLYNPSAGIYNLLAREFAPLKSRLISVQSRLEGLPRNLDAARENLKNPPRVYTETAIQQNKGAVSLIRDELEEFVKREPSMGPRLAPARARAIAALESHGIWLEKDLLPRSTGDFRIGRDAFAKKLRFALDSDLSPDDILRQAQSELLLTQAQILETALPLFQRHFPERATNGLDRKVIIRAVYDKLAETRPDNSTIVEQATALLASATEFARSRQLVTIPSDPVKVIVMPEFARGFSVAYCDAAGALDKNGETFYAISPTPQDWSAERTTSFFREYNHAMLGNLTVHEAMPGHYLQIVVANKVPTTTKIRHLFGSGTFIEGWATYAEQIMADAGFGGPETKMQQMKMRLRLIINAIIDHKIHAGTMTQKEAIDLMMNEGFQEEGEAAGKWRRAQLSSTQLSTYFVGNVEVNDLASDMKAKLGGSPKVMHDRMLSYGSIATRYIRQLSGL